MMGDGGIEELIVMNLQIENGTVEVDDERWSEKLSDDKVYMDLATGVGLSKYMCT